MKALCTPAKTESLVALVVVAFLAAPVVVLAHFFIRMARGDYPPDADSIGIPVFSYWLFVFPVGLLLLIHGLRTYTAGTPLMNWNRRRPWRSVAWTVLSLFPLGLVTIGLILDGIQWRLYWVSLFFLLQLYCILLLRACVVGAGDHATEPYAAPNGGPTQFHNSGVGEVKRYTNRPRLWLAMSGIMFVVLSLLPSIPGIAGSRVTDYLTSTFAAPFLFVMEPAAGADALANGIVGLGFYIALALIVGWCLHCIVVLLVPALRRGAGPEPNQPRQPTAAPPRATPP